MSERDDAESDLAEVVLRALMDHRVQEARLSVDSRTGHPVDSGRQGLLCTCGFKITSLHPLAHPEHVAREVARTVFRELDNPLADVIDLDVREHRGPPLEPGDTGPPI